MNNHLPVKLQYGCVIKKWELINSKRGSFSLGEMTVWVLLVSNGRAIRNFLLIFPSPQPRKW